MSDRPILLGYQGRYVADEAPVVLVEKSRRIGLSWSDACAATLHASAASGASCYYISFDKEMTRTYIEDCAMWAGAFHGAAERIGEQVLTRDDGKDIHVYDLPFASGFSIKAFSSNPRNLRSKGKPGERLTIDEAAFVDDLPELLKAAMAMTMWGGRIRLLSTHNGTENPFAELVEETRKGRNDYSLHRITLDDALADGLYQQICRVTGRVWTQVDQDAWREALIKRYRPNHDEELFCVPAFGGGSYLPRALVEPCMIDAPVLAYQGTAKFNSRPLAERSAEMADWISEHLAPLLSGLDRARRHAFGMDFARSGDQTVMLPVEIGQDLHRRAVFQVELHNTPFAQQQEVLWTILRGLPRLAKAALDARGNGQQLAENARDEFGAVVDPVMLSQGWYLDRFPKYKRALEDREFHPPRSDDVLDDHRAVRLVNGVPKVPEGKTDGAGQRHGDSAIAGCLAEYAAEGGEWVYEWMPAPPRATDAGDSDDDDFSSPHRGSW